MDDELGKDDVGQDIFFIATIVGVALIFNFAAYKVDLILS